jgi:hypothetical protein
MGSEWVWQICGEARIEGGKGTGCSFGFWIICGFWSCEVVVVIKHGGLLHDW